MSQDRYNVEIRPLFDAWFTGWSDQLKAQGLGYNMKPLKRKPRTE